MEHLIEIQKMRNEFSKKEELLRQEREYLENAHLQEI